MVYSEVRVVDKITDLPIDYSKYLSNRRPTTVQSQPYSGQSAYDRQPTQVQFSSAEPTQELRPITLTHPGLFILNVL